MSSGSYKIESFQMNSLVHSKDSQYLKAQQFQQKYILIQSFDTACRGLNKNTPEAHMF